MDLASPLHSLIPALSSRTLEVLAGTESALGVAQIARLARDGTAPGHAKALDRLVEHGLVVADPTNKGFSYRLNRNHVLFPAISLALDARARVFQLLTTAVTDMAPQVIHASVFGSFARGDGHSRSDIDILLVVEDDETRQSEGWRTQVRALEDDVLTWTGNRLEALVFSELTLRNAVIEGEPLVGSLLRESIHLAGKSRLRELVDTYAPNGSPPTEGEA